MEMNTMKRRVLAMILAIAILISNLALGAAAEDLPSCDIADHAHTEECYATGTEPAETEPTVPETETENTEATVPGSEEENTEATILETEAEATETTATETEATEEVVSATEVTEAVPECSCGTVTEIHSTQCALHVPTFLERLLAAQTLQELHDTMMADAEAVYAMNEEELTALKNRAEELYVALEEPTQDEQDYYDLIVDTVLMLLNVRNAEDNIQVLATGDYIQIGTQTYDIDGSDIKNLVEADRALLRWEAKGSEDNSAISAVINGTTYQVGTTYATNAAVYAAVYEELYKILLDKATEISDGDAITVEDINYTNNVAILKISGTVLLDGTSTNSTSTEIDKNVITVSGSKRLVILAEQAATISVKDKAGFATSGNSGSNLIIQGRSEQAKITIDGNSKNGTSHANVAFIKNNGGSLYLNHTVLQQFTFGAAEKFDSVIDVPNGNSNGRYIYMSNSTMQDITGGCSPGIFLRAYHTSSITSKAYFYNNLFTRCVTKAGYQYAGGPVLRTYAADSTQVRMESCQFLNNKNNSEGANAGGGAIFWKSAVATAKLIDCTFKSNYSATSGGAIFNVGKMEIQRCTFGGEPEVGANGEPVAVGNTAKKNGGAIVVEPPFTSGDYPAIANNMSSLQGSLKLDSESHIINNHANGNGGAIYFHPYASAIGKVAITSFPMQLEINGTTIHGNTAGGNGGAVAIELDYGAEYTYATGVQITAGNITENKAENGNGGAIWMRSTSSCACKGNTGVKIFGGTLQGNVAKNGGGIYIETGMPIVNTEGETKMSVVMSGGNVQSNTATVNGGAAYISGGNFTMSGGTLGSENLANSAVLGGGVYVNDGKATVSGGFVQYNTANDGAGIYVNGGAAEISGTGQITHNVATNNGGGAFITGGDFYLNGAEAQLQKNKATNGAGIYLTGGSPNLLQGKLMENEASQDGGGIYINQRNVTLNPQGSVTINGNKAARGAGLFIAGTNGTDASFSVNPASGGTVDLSGNTASAEGGGVCIDKGYFNLSADNITIHRNTAHSGGAVAVLDGNFTLSGGHIGAENNANTAVNGGGVYVTGGDVHATVTITGGSICYNKATANGGGAYITGGSFQLNGDDAVVSHNNAIHGAGIFLTGGEPNLLRGTMQNNAATGNGGGIYIDRRHVVLQPEGVVRIVHNNAVDGAGIYIGGTEEAKASFSVSSESTGNVQICDNIASGNGAGVCISNGQFTLNSDRITLQRNTADNGGAVAVLSGDFLMSSGKIDQNHARVNGGGIQVDGGNAYISGGTIESNTAQINGGGIAVDNGKIIMSDGSVNSNTATTGNGGGMYVASLENTAEVMVYSGYITNNTSATNGGAVAVQGGANNTIKVQIGVNKDHFDADGKLQLGFTHEENQVTYTHKRCPTITGNSASTSGGAFYISGGGSTELDIFCLEENGNESYGDKDINDVPLSDFLMVNGGTVIISTADSHVCPDNDHDHSNTDKYGHAKINGSVHVAGGRLDLFGSMENPSFEKQITVDLTKEADHYHDHRANNGYIKLSYHENFDFNGVVDSTQTALDLRVGEEHIISDSLYRHDGYEIVGWNTKADNTGDSYSVGATYVFVLVEPEETDDNKRYQIGDLTLYAIWKPNGYEVHFDPNVPQGETYGGTQMPFQPFTYNVEQALHKNTYIRSGYIFSGWSYTDDKGQPQTVADEARVKNLTSVRGGKVVLKAIWVQCNHEGAFAYTATENVVQQTAMLAKTCALCQYSETITLTAADATYDGQSHPATKVCSRAEWFGQDIQIVYTGTKIGSTDSVDSPALTTNAGNYVATITAPDGTAASVRFQIAKASQPAPSVKPTYTEPETGNTILTVHPLNPDSENVSSTSELPVEFIARYYVDGAVKETDWHPIERKTTQVAEGESIYKDTSIELVEELKYYFVYARYPGDDNYLPSDEVMANGAFLFQGKITLIFDADKGITYFPESTEDGQLKIKIKVSNDYYLVGGKTTVEVCNDTQKLISIIPDGNEDFIITATKVSQENTEITIKIGQSKKKATISGLIQEGQIFGNVVGEESPQISRDSAFTFAYVITNYDTNAYEQPVLKFYTTSETGETPVFLPVGTTIIMQSKHVSSVSYWYYTVDALTSSIDIGKFIRMGSSNSDKFLATTGELKLQFVVDFSNVSGGLVGDTNAPLQTLGIVMQFAKNDVGAPELPNYLSVGLVNTGFNLAYESGSGLSHTLTYSFSPGISASRWDHRELALVVDGGSNLPADAVISARVDGKWRDCRPYATGKYIIPLGSNLSGTVELTLESDMIPLLGTNQASIRYPVQCRLYAAASIADTAPLNGTVVVGTSVECTFTSTQKTVAVNVSETDDRHLFTSQDNIRVNVEAETNGLAINVQLQHKDQKGIYVDTGRKSETETNPYEFTLNGCAPGSYRIVVSLEQSNRFVVAEAYYYFIIE